MPSTLKLDKWQNTAGVNYNSILQVVTATSGFTKQTFASSTPVQLTGMSVTIRPYFANSKILIMGVVTASWTYVAGVHIYKNLFDIIGSHGSNLQNGGSSSIWTYYNQGIGAGTGSLRPMSLQYMDTANSTNNITYSIYANSGWNGAAPDTFYFNTRDTDDMLSSSYLTVMEIAQ